jgi:cytochrome c553
MNCKTLKFCSILIFFASTTVFGGEIGKNYYHLRCSKCHGENGEKKAFNIAQPIKNLDKETFVLMLNGYKDGTYGGKMQYFMQHFVKNLQKNDMEKLYKQIHSTKDL